jgi:hypothetical protein
MIAVRLRLSSLIVDLIIKIMRIYHRTDAPVVVISIHIKGEKEHGRFSTTQTDCENNNNKDKKDTIADVEMSKFRWQI